MVLFLLYVVMGINLSWEMAVKDHPWGYEDKNAFIKFLKTAIIRFMKDKSQLEHAGKVLHPW